MNRRVGLCRRENMSADHRLWGPARNAPSRKPKVLGNQKDRPGSGLWVRARIDFVTAAHEGECLDGKAWELPPHHLHRQESPIEFYPRS